VYNKQGLYEKIERFARERKSGVDIQTVAERFLISKTYASMILRTLVEEGVLRMTYFNRKQYYFRKD
jgi:ribosomal protein S25